MTMILSNPQREKPLWSYLGRDILLAIFVEFIISGIGLHLFLENFLFHPVRTVIGITIIIIALVSVPIARFSRSKRSSNALITKTPGTKLMDWVRLCYSAKSVDKIFEPIYADFCEEYFAALASGHTWHARWIRVRYYKDFVKAVGLFGVVRLAKTVFEYWEKIA